MLQTRASPYMLLFLQALTIKGWQGSPCWIGTAGERLVLHTARPIQRDRPSLGSLPGPIDDWRDVLRAPVIEGPDTPRSCARQGETNMWYVGLDWADTHHDVEVQDEAGKRVGA